MQTPLLSAACPPQGAVNCEPAVQATATAYFLQNKKKIRNLIWAEITSRGYFKFQVENLPKDKTGCPGWGLVQVAWQHFVNDQKVTINGIRGDWTYGDNLETVNGLTAGNRMSLEDAAKQTWTYRQAIARNFTVYQCLAAIGVPGNYTEIQVVFLP